MVILGATVRAAIETHPVGREGLHGDHFILCDNAYSRILGELDLEVAVLPRTRYGLAVEPAVVDTCAIGLELPGLCAGVGACGAHVVDYFRQLLKRGWMLTRVSPNSYIILSRYS